MTQAAAVASPRPSASADLLAPGASLVPPVGPSVGQGDRLDQSASPSSSGSRGRPFRVALTEPREVSATTPLTPLEQTYVNAAVNRAKMLDQLTSDDKPQRPDRGIRAALEEARRQPNGESLYRRAIELIATVVCSAHANRVAHARAVLESLRDPLAEDGRGWMAADLYQRIEPATANTPAAEQREGRFTPEELLALDGQTATPPDVPTPGVGGPNWSRSLSSFNSSRVDVELPSGAPDYMSYKPYRFGTARTIETIKRVAERHRQATGLRLRVGDIAKQGGGRIPDHNSHRTGNIFDLDIVFNDGRTTAEPNRDSVDATWRSPAYDRANTRKLIQIIKAIRPEAQILFNDPVLVREGLVTQFPNHDNHLHVQRLN